eukprot:43191_1
MSMMDASSIQFQRTPVATPFQFHTRSSRGGRGGDGDTSASMSHLKGGKGSGTDTNTHNDNVNDDADTNVKKQVENAFQNLHTKHDLSQSPDVLALAATRAYN